VTVEHILNSRKIRLARAIRRHDVNAVIPMHVSLYLLDNDPEYRDKCRDAYERYQAYRMAGRRLPRVTPQLVQEYLRYIHATRGGCIAKFGGHFTLS
jgi:hypothetical protein